VGAAVGRRDVARRAAALGFAAALALAAAAAGREFDVTELTPRDGVCRAPVASDTGMAAWLGLTEAAGDETGTATRTDVWVCAPGGEPQNVTGGKEMFSGRIESPVASGDALYFLAWYSPDAEEGPPFTLRDPELTDEMKSMADEYPSLFAGTVTEHARETPPEGENGEGSGDAAGEAPSEENASETEIRHGLASQDGGSVVRWQDGQFKRLTPGGHAFYAPSASEAGAAFLCARSWPYGYEAVAWSPEGGLTQLTTNYFYVQDVKMQGRQVVYQAWDGNDYEIYLHDFDTDETRQLTNNTFDDIHPDLWGGQVVWTAFPVANGEIFHWADGTMKKISENSRDNDAACICNGRVVWQGLDDTGDHAEIFYYDGKKTIKLTSNIWDDLAPKIRGDLVAWVSYVDLADAEIMALDLRDNIPVQLTNDGEEDSGVSIGGDRIVWQTSLGDKSFIRMAVGKPIEEAAAEE